MQATELKSGAHLWTIDQVATWARTLPNINEDHISSLKRNKVTGDTLPLFNEDQFTKHPFNLPRKPAQIIIREVKKLFPKNPPTLEEYEELKKKVALLQQQLDLLYTVDVWPANPSSSADYISYEKKLIKYYELDCAKCMVTGITDNEQTIIAAHIWPLSARNHHLVQKYKLDENDIDSPRNGFLLLDTIEHAFYKKDLCFIYDPFKGTILLHIINPSLKEKEYVKGKSFSTLEGSAIILPEGKLPYRRFLATHARAAFYKSLCSGWITDDFFRNCIDQSQLADIASLGPPDCY